MNFLRMPILIYVFKRFTTRITNDLEKIIILLKNGLQSNSIEWFLKEGSTDRKLLM